MKKISLVIILAVFSYGIFNFETPNKTSAVFNQNKLIDTAVFNNTSSMTASQIDAFLNGFPNSCISPNKGFSSPNPIGYNPSQGYLFGGNVTAGQVISSATQAYGLNPQVILATLQKEQSLITGGAGCHYETPPILSPCPEGSSPTCMTACQYSGGCVYIALGYGCPHYCDPNSAGFSKQVIKATWMLKFSQERSEGNVNWNVQKPGWDNSDDPPTYYSGNMTEGWRKRIYTQASSTYFDGLATIDGTTIHLDNGATVALYRYTPFLIAGQSFVTKFEQWFGSTIAPSYAWQPFSQEAYFDANKTVPADTGNATPGFKYYLVIKAKNIGNQTWQKNQANIGTSTPNNRLSSFYDSSWLIANRTTTLKETQVAPGEDGTFEFWVKAPNNVGSYKEYFNLVAEGITWMNDIGLYYSFNIKSPNYSWKLSEQNAYTDQTKSAVANLSNTVPNSKYYLRIKAKNTGNLAWMQSFTKIGTSNQKDRTSAVYDATWDTTTRPDKLNEPIVYPGQFGTFEFWVKAPNNVGSYKEYFNLVAEGITWMNDIGLYYSFNIKSPNYSWQYISQNIYTDSSKAVPAVQTSLSRNTRYYLTVKARNTGNTTWQNNVVKLGTSNPRERLSDFDDAEWLTTTRPTNLLETTVPPGSIGTFEFWIKTPNNSTNSKEYFNLLAENITWMNELGLNFDLKVN